MYIVGHIKNHTCYAVSFDSVKVVRKISKEADN